MLFNPDMAQTHKIPANHDKIAYLLSLWTTLLFWYKKRAERGPEYIVHAPTLYLGIIGRKEKCR